LGKKGTKEKKTNSLHLIFHKILHSYNLFSSNEGVFKGHKHSFSKVYTSHGNH
jgi:hypothetical protein